MIPFFSLQTRRRVAALKPLSVILFLAILVTGTSLSAQDVKAGKKVFKKCKACHSLKPDDSRVGPTLYNIVGAPSGAAEGFRYSSAMKKADLVWDEETLAAFFVRPKNLVPGTSMSFGGLKKEDQILDLIAYLRAEAGEWEGAVAQDEVTN
jgi:cytochrome c